MIRHELFYLVIKKILKYDYIKLFLIESKKLIEQISNSATIIFYLTIIIEVMYVFM